MYFGLPFALDDCKILTRLSVSTLRTDAMSGIRTSFIGTSLEQTYRACTFEKGQSHHYHQPLTILTHPQGRGSDSRRKSIMNTALRRHSLFEDLMRTFRDRFQDLADSAQAGIQRATTGYLDVVRGTLDIVRSENAALEGEREPEFRARVEEEVRAAKENMAAIKERIV